MDINMLKQEEDNNEIVRKLSKEYIELLCDYQKVWDSSELISMKKRFIQQMLKGFATYLERNGFNISEEENNVSGAYKNLTIEMQFDKDRFYIKTSKNEVGYPLIIQVSDKTCYKPLHKGTILTDGKILYPASVKNPDNIDFLNYEIRVLREDIINLKQKIVDFMFVCKFDYGIECNKEFTTIEEVFKSLY